MAQLTKSFLCRHEGPGFRRQRQAELYEFESSLVYIMENLGLSPRALVILALGGWKQDDSSGPLASEPGLIFKLQCN